MQRSLAFALLLFLLTVPCQGAEFGAWDNVGSKDGVSLSQRQNTKSGLNEYRAVGTVDAPVDEVLEVLENVKDAPEFMPYVKSVKLIDSTPGRQIFYQRIQPPFVTDRDYTLTFVTTKRDSPEGPAYRLTWVTANEKGPAVQEGVVRVEVNEGYWDLEPTDGGKATKLAYSVYTDIGSGIPPFLLKKGNAIALPKLFKAIRKRVAEN